MAYTALALPLRVEDAAVRQLFTESAAKRTELIIIEEIATYTWNAGPYIVQTILSSYVAIGIDFVEPSNESYHYTVKQFPGGQAFSS